MPDRSKSSKFFASKMKAIRANRYPYVIKRDSNQVCDPSAPSFGIDRQRRVMDSFIRESSNKFDKFPESLVSTQAVDQFISPTPPIALKVKPLSQDAKKEIESILDATEKLHDHCSTEDQLKKVGSVVKAFQAGISGALSIDYEALDNGIPKIRSVNDSFEGLPPLPAKPLAAFTGGRGNDPTKFTLKHYGVWINAGVLDHAYLDAEIDDMLALKITEKLAYNKRHKKKKNLKKDENAADFPYSVNEIFPLSAEAKDKRELWLKGEISDQTLYRQYARNLKRQYVK